MISNEIIYLRDFADEAEKRRGEFGRTNLFTTGVPGLDTYLGGGFGRRHGYEIVLVFGPPKIGKSLVTLNLVAQAVKAGKRVGLMVLEDDGADVYLRLTNILGATGAASYVTSSDHLRMLPVDAMLKAWKLDDLLIKIEEWFVADDRDLILLDHINFAFENAETIKGENEYNKQRVFMRNLNFVMKKTGKTLILVSHVSKGPGGGMDKVMGSSAIAGAATKIIEVKKDKLGVLYMHLHGSRFTRTPDQAYPISLSGPNQTRLEDGRL